MFDTKDGVGLTLYVMPKSNRSYLEFKEGEILFHSSASCKNHGVNRDLLKWLSRNIGSKPVIIKGWSDRRKILSFNGIGKEKLITSLVKVLKRAGKQ
ncbi:MAG: hypothetical protein F7B60_03325 [Desulfurococcales archaeon]|nr:hypothetical protein [Desulfurococcales archaeon]